MRFLILFFCVCASFINLSASDEYICRPVSEKIKIDGKLDEKAWMDAPGINAFMTLGPAGEAAKNPAEIKLLFDRDYLYIGAKFKASPGLMPFVKEQMKRDFLVWGSDCMDFFIQPEENRDIIYQFMIAANGELSDLCYKQGVEKPEKWNCNILTKTTAYPGGWTLEAALPLKELSESHPKKGDVWAFRIGIAAKGFPLSMWPWNVELAFNNKKLKAYLIFEDREILPNPDFTPGNDEKKTAPGWRYALPSDKLSGRGYIKLLKKDDASGYMIELRQESERGYFPALLTGDLKLKPGAEYELTARVKSDAPFLFGISGLLKKSHPEMKAPEKWRKMPVFQASDDFKEITQKITVPDNIDSSSGVVFRFEGHKGTMLIEKVSLKRINGISDAIPDIKADVIHNLREIAERTPFKAFYYMKQKNGWYKNDKVVFKDSATNAEIWLMTRCVDVKCRHRYMEMTPWNANGSFLELFSMRQVNAAFIRMEADASEWLPVDSSLDYVWDRHNPDIIWITKNNVLNRLNIKTGEMKAFPFSVKGTLSLCSSHADGKYLLLESRYEKDGKPASMIYLVPTEEGKGKVITLDPGLLIHLAWFTNKPDYSIVYSEEVEYWNFWIMTPDGKKRKTPGAGNHRAIHPEGKWAVGHGEGVIYDFYGDRKAVVLPGQRGSNHQSWAGNGKFFVGSSGFDIYRFLVEPVMATQKIGSANSRMKYNTYGAEEHPVISPDGTKCGYASNMLGHVDFYNIVVRMPDPPENLRALEKNNISELSWGPGKSSNETRLYRIYHASSPAGPYSFHAETPIQERKILVSGKEGYFAVAAQEHSGLQSLYSQPLHIPCGKGEAFISKEAENSDYKAPAEEVFDASAANLYALSCGTREISGEINFNIKAENNFDGFAYIRTRVLSSLRGTDKPSFKVSFNSSKPTEIKLTESSWHWLEASGSSPLKIPAGSFNIKIIPLGKGLLIDQVILSGKKETFPGTYFWGKDFRAPGPVKSLSAKALDPYTVKVDWKAGKEDIAYYNVYCSEENTCEPSNRTLAGSPLSPELLDWGLKAGKKYTYTVTAIDRMGNESAPCKEISVQTPALEERIFERYGKEQLIPKGKGSIDLKLNLPEECKAMLWVKLRALSPKVDNLGLDLFLNGKKMKEENTFIPWHYITNHHGGPEKGVCLWMYIDNMSSKVTKWQERLFQFGKGPAILSIVPVQRRGKVNPEDIEISEIVLTNDLGFVPKGICNYLFIGKNDK